jgi:hypothetical protein
MKVKYALIFFVGILALAASEYLFLLELSSQNRFYVLVSTSVIAVVSVIAIFKCYKRIS